MPSENNWDQALFLYHRRSLGNRPQLCQEWRMTKNAMPPCPICNKPPNKETSPFCSTHCRHVDLNRWFTGGYAVPSVELDEGDMDAIEQASPDDSKTH